MVRKIIYSILVFLVFVSCKQNGEDNLSDTLNNPDSQLNQEVKISSIGIVLSPSSRKLTEDWSKFQLLKSKIENYTKVTKSEALLNAKELSDLIIDTSDTIDIKMLDRADMKIRFNVLNNHALRLDDMSTISKITDQEVEDEVSKLLIAFSSINEKINTLITIDEIGIKSKYSESVTQKIEKNNELEISSETTKEISAKRKYDGQKIRTLKKGSSLKEEMLIKRRGEIKE